MSTVSVVIPCYNGSRFLRATLQSVLSQTTPALEIIVVDDGSTDDSAAVAESFGPPVRVIRQANRGESVARNRAIAEAKGAWIGLLDADDIWEPTKNARQLETLSSAGEDVVCCYSDVYSFEDDRRLDVIVRPETHLLPDPFVPLLFDWCVVPSASLVRTDAARAVPFPEDVRRGEDVLFFAMLSQQGRFLRVPEPLVGYRRSVAQQTRTPLHGLDSLLAKYEWFERNRHSWSTDDVALFGSHFKDALVDCHDSAYWNRLVDIARTCRREYRRVFPEAPLPPLMQRRLYPRWMFHALDRLRSNRASVAFFT